uniref:Uncharacterized protein n=1 Tax=Oryza rufipogon TaxID=4529 RepID=A0A0E0QI16_ORYRU
MIEERHGETCHLEDHELEKIYGPPAYETDYDSDESGVSFYINGRNIFMKYGDGFRYEDRNPYYAADKEETWEKQILRQMKFPIPDLSESWEGSLVVEGPFNLDPNLTFTDHLMPALPKWERRWLDRDGKEPCRRAIQVHGLNLSSPSNVLLEIYGIFAFRDTRNSQLRNYAFDYSRENPCKLKPFINTTTIRVAIPMVLSGTVHSLLFYASRIWKEFKNVKVTWTCNLYGIQMAVKSTWSIMYEPCL